MAAARPANERRVEMLDVSELHLDVKNPRLPEDLVGGAEAKILKYLYENAVLDELAQSFVDNGYFPAEPLIVAKEKGHYVVLEGNRRLATLMILHGLPAADELSFVDLDGDPKAVAALESVPCYVVPNRQEVVPFIGFRHIGGLKMWEPEAKARYILQQVDDAHKGRAEKPFLDVARRVGSNTQSIRNSYVAIAILRHARSEMGLNVSKLLGENRFGVWQRALNGPDLRHYIGFGDPTTYEDVQAALAKLKKSKLKEVTGDLVPAPGMERAVVSDSRFVTDYGKVLANEQAHETLRRTNDLELARQVITELDLPTRVLKLKNQASVLREQVARVDMFKELRDAINELSAEVRQLKALTSEPA